MYEYENELFEKTKGVKLINQKNGDYKIFVGEDIDKVKQIVKSIKHSLENGFKINWETLVAIGIKFYEEERIFIGVECFDLVETIEYYL